jgi:hypothetical protein
MEKETIASSIALPTTSKFGEICNAIQKVRYYLRPNVTHSEKEKRDENNHDTLHRWGIR